MSEEDAWYNWGQLIGRGEHYEGVPLEWEDDIDILGQERREPDQDGLNETLAYEEVIDDGVIMAQGGVDIAALLQQLTQANIDRNARDVAADQRAAAAAIGRAQEDLVRIQVSKIEKCVGDDKPKLRRWLRDVGSVHANHPGVAVPVAERTARENLADTLEAFMADAANAPRVGITWPAVRDNIQTLLLGDAYGEVLRAEHRTIRQKAHESTTIYSERYLGSAKNAYEEPWDRITNQALIALFAEGLLDKRMARDVGVIMRRETLRETINQARSYAGIEATMNLRDRDHNIAAVTEERVAEPAPPRPPTVAAVTTEDERYRRLEKQNCFNWYTSWRDESRHAQATRRRSAGVLQLWKNRPLRSRM